MSLDKPSSKDLLRGTLDLMASDIYLILKGLKECPTTITQIPFKMPCATYKFYRNVNIPMFSVYTGRDTVLQVHAVNDVVSELLGKHSAS